MTDHCQPENWRKLRFIWKEQLMQSQDISRGAKNLGVLLCDKYVCRKSGKCWPSNVTLASAMAVDLRTIQRHIKDLKAEGWLKQVAIPKRRRTLKLAFPAALEDDNEDDRCARRSASFPSPEHDKTVVVHNKDKEPSKNQEKINCKDWAFPVAHVGSNEELCISEWLTWLAKNTNLDPNQVMKAVRLGNIYQMPRRFPSEDASKHAVYVEYFEAMLGKGE